MIEKFKAWIKQYPAISGLVGIVVLAILIAVLWTYGMKAWNGVGNKIFEWKIGKKQEQVNKELADAAAQKKALDQTLFDLAQSKKDLAEVKAEKDRLEKVFNDASKTASEKVAEFKKIVGSEPSHTDTNGVTLQSLCERARQANASAATIAALCN